MPWGPFSAEAVTLDSKLRQLHKEGRVSDAIGAIEEALERAHSHGPSNMSYEDFERAASDPPADWVPEGVEKPLA